MQLAVRTNLETGNIGTAGGSTDLTITRQSALRFETSLPLVAPDGEPGMNSGTRSAAVHRSAQ
jgi:hypothetical protein